MTDDLTQQAQILTAAVERLTNSVAELSKRQQRMRRVVTWTVAGLVADATLSIGAFLLYDHQREVSDRVAENSRRIEQTQIRTSTDVLCPLYQVFLGSYDRARRDALSPDRQRKYDEAFAVIRFGAEKLGCPAR